jgi:hypothetical protein
MPSTFSTACARPGCRKDNAASRARSAANLLFGSRRSSVKAPARKNVGSGSRTRVLESSWGRGKCPCNLPESLQSQNTLIQCPPTTEPSLRRGLSGNAITFSERKPLGHRGKMTQFARVAEGSRSAATPPLSADRRAPPRVSGSVDLSLSTGTREVSRATQAGTPQRRRRYFCGINFVPVGPIPVIWTITSPSLAQTKCGVSFGSEKNVPVGYGLSLLSSHLSPSPK